jgi:hypothetical protein
MKRNTILIIIGVAIGVLIYIGVRNSKSDVETWLQTLPEEQRECLKIKVGVRKLEDIQSGRIVGTTLIETVDNANCGVEWR